MAMSRSLGSRSLTTLSPMRSSPDEIVSSPAIIRSAVDLPQPDGPTSTKNSLSAMSSDEVVHGVEPVVVDLVDAVELDRCHVDSPPVAPDTGASRS